MSILKNLKRLKIEISDDIKLVVVTKNRSIREINQLLFLGVQDIGENKVKEAKEKKPFVKEGAKWHMSGHLQRNKAKDAIEIFDMIQSVDSLKLAKKLDLLCRLRNKVMAVLVQVNISEEPQKYGFREAEVIPFLNEINNLKHIKVLGLMAIAPRVRPENTKFFFSKMKSLFEKIKLEKISNINMKYLSMGMSNDYYVAIQEGANMVRIGTAVFEDKQTSNN